MDRSLASRIPRTWLAYDSLTRNDRVLGATIVLESIEKENAEALASFQQRLSDGLWEIANRSNGMDSQALVVLAIGILEKGVQEINYGELLVLCVGISKAKSQESNCRFLRESDCRTHGKEASPPSMGNRVGNGGVIESRVEQEPSSGKVIHVRDREACRLVIS